MRPRARGGKFVRQDSQFRNWVTRDGAPGRAARAASRPSPAATISMSRYACPWAHRTLILRTLKKLEDAISVSVVAPLHGRERLDVHGRGRRHRRHALRPRLPAPDLHQGRSRPIPAASPCRCCGTSSAQTIVSNEFVRDHPHAEFGLRRLGRRLARLLSRARCAARSIASTRWSIPAINNGVYRAGFATTQEAYEEAFRALFDALDELEERLTRQRYLAGDRLTEADWRLFTTLVRFDPVYVGHFKCNLRRIADYPNLSNYLRDLYQVPGVAETVEHAPHQGALLRQPRHDQPDAHRAGRAGDRPLLRRTIATGSQGTSGLQR